MARPVSRVALTGGIATGKTYSLKRFELLGAATVNADTLARRAVESGTPGLAAIVRRFGPGVLDADGVLDRKALAAMVFSDAAARRDLEAIVHPAVYDAIEAWFADVAAGRADEPPAGPDTSAGAGPVVAMAEIPLLYETGREDAFDAVVVTACSPEQQVARMRARDGLDDTEARRRLAAQLPIDEKARRADFVVDTSGTEADTDAAIDRVWRALAGAPGDRP